jgi:hypothetical protein
MVDFSRPLLFKYSTASLLAVSLVSKKEQA